MVVTLEPKGKEAGEIGVLYYLRGQQLLPVKSGYLTQHHLSLRNVKTPYCSQIIVINNRDSDSQEKPMAVRVWEVRRSECRHVTCRIGVSTSPHAKAGPRLTGLSLREKLENRKNEGKQMTAVNIIRTGASSASNLTWGTINWKQVSEKVSRLQFRIAKAIREKRYGKAKALQWLLTNSYSAKLLAVRRVTQSSGSKTPGVDGILWRTPKQKMKAVKLYKGEDIKPCPCDGYISLRNRVVCGLSLFLL